MSPRIKFTKRVTISVSSQSNQLLYAPIITLVYTKEENTSIQNLIKAIFVEENKKIKSKSTESSQMCDQVLVDLRIRRMLQKLHFHRERDWGALQFFNHMIQLRETRLMVGYYRWHEKFQYVARASKIRNIQILTSIKSVNKTVTVNAMKSRSNKTLWCNPIQINEW